MVIFTRQITCLFLQKDTKKTSVRKAINPTNLSVNMHEICLKITRTLQFFPVFLNMSRYLKIVTSAIKKSCFYKIKNFFAFPFTVFAVEDITSTEPL